MKEKAKGLKNLIFLFFIFIFFLVPANAFAQEDYTLTSYNIDIIVEENNVLEIKEKINANFNVEKHGIFRSIPTFNKVIREDGSITYNRARIYNVSVSDNYKSYYEDNNMIIQIGDEDITLTGNKAYEISYSYNLGKDTNKEFDELYFNLIGELWDTTISNVTFSITLPKNFDEKKLGFTHGVYGSSDTSGITYTIKDNVIKGNYINTLNESEGLTVRLELPEGYFVDAGYKIDYKNILAVIVPIIFTAISFYLWKKYGKDDQFFEPVEFYPPKGLNSAEVGFNYKGYANKNDVVSLLIFLANKGYLKIEEVQKKSLLTNSNDFKLIKVKDYDGTNDNEKLFLEELFKGRTTVTKEDLKEKFYETINSIQIDLNSSRNKHLIFNKNSLNKRYLLVLMIYIVVACITIIPILDYGDPSTALLAFGFTAANFTIPLFIPITEKKKKSLILGILFSLTIGNLLGFMFLIGVLFIENIYLLTYIIGLISIVTLIVLFKLMPKRTQYGNELLGKIGGFRNFLDLAEKEKLEMLVNETPNYFYNILPFTYVLGLSDKWIKKFESIALAKPDWYVSNRPFDVIMFNYFMNSTMSSATTAMTSMPTSSTTGGGFSGGGFSGGGSGGGGGGSW